MSKTINYKKKYEKALEIARKHYEETPNNVYKAMLESLFPELAESEDERIIKEIIQSIKGSMIVIHKDKCLAWLEKVGEDNKFLKSIKVGDIITKSPDGILINLGQSDRVLEHNDKVEPKFHIGDWVVDEDDNNIYQIENVIENVTNGKFSYDLVGGGYFPSTKKNYHLWSIADAKHGDVLIDHCDDYKNPLIFILKKFERVDFGLAQKSDYSSYCFLTAGDKQRFKEGTYHHKHNIKPATKEQRDILFQKMYDAGYTFDFKKKKLKKLKFKVGDEVTTECEGT